jgi:hypothetical protein
MGLIDDNDMMAYFEEHPEAVKYVEAFDFQTRIGADPCYRKATLDDVKHVSVGGWRGEPGVYAWLYPCGVPTYIWVGGMPPIDPAEVNAWRTFDDAEEAYREFKRAMYDHEFGYDPDDWDVLRNFGTCPDGYGRKEWMAAWGYGLEIIEAYERAREDVLAASGW